MNWNWTVRDWTGLDGHRFHVSGVDRTGLSRTAPQKTELNGTALNWTALSWAELDFTRLHYTALPWIELESTIQDSETDLYRTALHVSK